jgi:hypothetical protein
MTKLQKAAKIAEYIKKECIDRDNWGNEYLSIDSIKTLFAHVDIGYHGDFGFDKIANLDEADINNLYGHIFRQRLNNFFDAPNAIKVLETEENFSNLNLYLNECLNCINAQNKIAAAILLRSCVEIFINIFEKTKSNLKEKIDNFFKNIDNHKDLKAFCEHGKKDELKEFLESVKNFGNDAAHVNGKQVDDVIEKYDSKNLLVLLCVLIEHSILKDSIQRMSQEDAINRLKSANFRPKEESKKCDIDDEIPF